MCILYDDDVVHLHHRGGGSEELAVDEARDENESDRHSTENPTTPSVGERT